MGLSTQPNPPAAGGALPLAPLVLGDGQHVLEAAHQRLHLPAAASHGAAHAGGRQHVPTVAALLQALQCSGG